MVRGSGTTSNVSCTPSPLDPPLLTRNSPLAEPCRAIFGTHAFGSQTPPSNISLGGRGGGGGVCNCEQWDTHCTLADRTAPPFPPTRARPDQVSSPKGTTPSTLPLRQCISRPLPPRRARGRIKLAARKAQHPVPSRSGSAFHDPPPPV